MRPQTNTVSSATTGSPLGIDYHENGFGVGFGCVISAGAVLTYKIQHTFDPIFSPDYTGTATWFDHSTVTGKTANQDGNYAFPIMAMRLNVTAYTSGNVTVTVLQGSSH